MKKLILALMLLAPLSTQAQNRIAEGLVALHADITETTTGDRTIVAAVSGKKIKVLGYVVSGDAAGAFTWKSGSTAISGAMEALSGVGIHVPATSWGAVTTAEGEALVLNIEAGTVIGGHVTYVLVD